jgi:hypothetical protein
MSRMAANTIYLVYVDFHACKWRDTPAVSVLVVVASTTLQKGAITGLDQHDYDWKQTVSFPGPSAAADFASLNIINCERSEVSSR